jgi:hypothetical protein
MNYQDYDAHHPGISAAAAECRMTPAAYGRWGESDRRAVIQSYTLMKLLGHESMVTSQRYVDGAGTRSAVELNPLYRLLATQPRDT